MPLHEQKSIIDNYADDTTLSLSFKLENPAITKSIFVTGPEWKGEMGQREQNVYEYAKNSSFVDNGEAPTKAHDPRYKKNWK